jgi:hypothetical protein
MRSRSVAWPRLGFVACVILASAGATAYAQEEPWEGTLDILGGETLYEDGWLFTLGYTMTRKAGLLQNDHRVGDPTHAVEYEQAVTLAAHYGLLHDVQLDVVVPYAFNSIHQENTPGPSRLAAEGLGDIGLFGKWEFFELYEPHKNLKCSLIGGLQVPTGSYHKSDQGVRLPPDLQPGTGAWDPFLGAGINYEPYRWKFDATVLYKRNGENGDHFHFGDELLVELAAGNRFYLEPFPGPFMRFDLELIYRHFGGDRLGGNAVDVTGRDLLTVGGRYVFRPRPSIDMQLEVGVPVYQRVDGIQLAETFSVLLVFAIRI